MDQFNEQLLLALASVAIAAAVLIRRCVKLVRNPGGSGCDSGGCSGCPSKNSSNTEGFVSLDQLTKHDAP